MSNSDKTILMTGGAGYVGSHTVLEFLQLWYPVVVVDNFSNSSAGKRYQCKKLSAHGYV